MSRMIKLLFLSLLFVTLNNLLHSEVQQVNVNADVKIEIDSEKPKINFKAEQIFLKENVMENNSEFLNINIAHLDAIKLLYNDLVFNKKLISPDLINIRFNPVFTFNFDIDPNVKIKKWTITVVNTKGEVFFVLGDNKKLPSLINWNGKNNKDEFLIPGQPYSYILKVWDDAGNEYTEKGVNFMILGGFYTKNNDKILSLSLLDLFNIKERKTDIKNIDLLKESADFLKSEFQYIESIKIVLYDENEELAFERLKQLAKYFTVSLNFKGPKVVTQFVKSHASNFKADIYIYDTK